MHRHDLDLIAAYASGDLDNEARARALVASCDECRSEYQFHVSILGELGDLEHPAMTSAEKASMHRDLWAELRAGPRTLGRSSESRSPLWYRWSAAAAGLFLVVGLLTVLINQTPQNDFETIGNELTAGEAPRFGDGDSSSGQGELGAGSPETTAADGAGFGSEGQPGAVAPDGAEGGDTYFAMIDQVRESEDAQFSGYASEEVADDTAACLRAAGLEGQRTIGEVDTETPYLLVIPADEPFESDSRITVVDSATCEVVHVDNPPTTSE